MESKAIHERLNNSKDTNARRALVCYLQYLMDYRRDVPDMDEHVLYELQRLLSTKYVRQLEESDPVHRILQSAEELEATDEQHSKSTWALLNRSISSLE